MPDVRWRRTWELFHAALDRPESEREAFVEAHADDPEMAEELRQLLAGHDAPVSVLGRPLSPRSGETAAATPDVEPDPESIGPYAILRKLGEGGMGVVYLAEQHAPMQRRVALKLIRLGMDTREFVARFEAERQALAMMNHPNVATVLDGGATERGRPYFVMEYVDGVPVTEHCDRVKLSTPERLNLFLQICSGVEHAHQRGIIHRDLKPSNALVTGEGAEATPKIIDFGVAKAVAPDPSAPGTLTRGGMLIGTPSYMSPEQTSRSPDLDIRTDVYSLGAMLYELLVGVAPFRADTPGQSVEETLERVREEMPPRPSTRVLGSDAADAASRRGAEPRTLARELRGDLDWICMMALAKECDRRYQSVGDLAADVRRHLNHQPVVAAAPGFGYRLGKFVRRHTLAVGAAAVVVTVAAAFTLAVTLQSIRLSQALDDKERERLKAAQLSNVLVEQILTLPDPELGKGETVTVKEMLEQSDRIAARLEDQPEMWAAVMFATGRIHLNLGMSDRAIEIFQEVLDRHRATLGSEHVDIAEALNWLANAVAHNAEFRRAEGLLRDALAMRRKLLGEMHLSTAESLNDLGLVLMALGEYPESEESLRQALAIRETLAGSDDPQVAQGLNNLGIVLRRRGRLDEAESSYRRALRIWRENYGGEHADIAMTLNNLALLLHVRGRYAHSEPMFRECLAMRRRLLGEEHPWVALTQANLAQLLRDMGRYEEAEALHREALDMRRRTHGEEHTYVAESLGNLAAVLYRQGKLGEAEQLQLQALDIQRALLGDEHIRVAGGRAVLALIRLERGAPAEAETLIQAALEVQRSAFGDRHPNVATTIGSLAAVKHALGEPGEAERLHRVSVETMRDLLREHPDVARRLMAYGTFLVDLGDPGRAEPVLREAHELVARLDLGGGALIARADLHLGACLRALGRFADAERLLLPALAVARETPSPGSERELRAELARLYDAWGRPEDAARHRSD